MKIHASKLKATIDDIEYEWLGGFGAVLKSYEKNVKKNEVRMIGDIVFYAAQVSKYFWNKEIYWCPQQEITIEWIRELKQRIFV